MSKNISFNSMIQYYLTWSYLEQRSFCDHHLLNFINIEAGIEIKDLEVILECLNMRRITPFKWRRNIHRFLQKSEQSSHSLYVILRSRVLLSTCPTRQIWHIQPALHYGRWVGCNTTFGLDNSQYKLLYVTSYIDFCTLFLI